MCSTCKFEAQQTYYYKLQETAYPRIIVYNYLNYCSKDVSTSQGDFERVTTSYI